MKRILFAALLFPAIASAQNNYSGDMGRAIAEAAVRGYAAGAAQSNPGLGQILNQVVDQQNRQAEIQQQQRFLIGLQAGREYTDQIMLKEILDQQQKQFDALYGR